MNVRSRRATFENLNQKARHAFDSVNALTRDKFVRGAKEIRDYSERASEGSDKWAECHLRLLAGIGAGVGVVVGIVLALP
jgi:hypothetical protein